MPTTRIAFGSCADQTQPQPIWRAIESINPNLFIFLGDNVYGDTLDMDLLARKYRQLGRIPEFRSFRSRVPVVGTWDDHDYGLNDTGAEYPMKIESKKIFLEFFGEPLFSDRRNRDGIYTSYSIGHSPCRVQILVLDLRWFRAKPGPHANLLGENQWHWLEGQLRQAADLRLICSSTQFAALGHAWDKWADYPLEKNRLLNLIDRLKIENLFVISGDMHFGELSAEVTPKGRQIFDLTSSGLNRWEPADGPNLRRIEIYESGPNFGLIEVNWKTRVVQLKILNEKGNVVFSHDVSLTRTLQNS